MKRDLLNKITKYSTASVASLAVASSANAEIVYTDVNPDTTISTGSGTVGFALDIDLDGNDDFQFFAYGTTFGQIRIYGSYSYSSVGGSKNGIAHASTGFGTAAYGFLFPDIFVSGSTIDGQLNFGERAELAAVESSSTYGGWGLPEGDSLIIGIKFEAGSGTEHYGWIRFNHSVSGPIQSNLTLIDFAYNNCPLAPITAGDTVANPGPCPAVEDLEAINNMEYTRIPLTQINGSESEITISNNGEIGTNDIILTTNIYKDPNYATPFQTDTVTGLSLDSLTSGEFSAVQFQPDSAGFYVFEHFISSDSINDIIPNNDTLYYTINVNKTFARDNNQVNSAFGAHVFDASGTVGTSYVLNNTGVVDSVVTVLMGPEYHGNPLSATIYGTDAITGAPDTNNILAHTDTITYDTAVGLSYTYLPVNGGPVELPAGRYFVGVHQQNGVRVRVATSDNIYTPGANWYREPSGVEFGTSDWFMSDLLGGAWEEAMILRLNFTDCLPSYDTTNVTLDPGTSIVVDGQPVSTAGTYKETLKNVDGCDSIIVYNVGITGVNEKQINNTEIFPNPTNGFININSNNEKVNKIRILDIQGKELLVETNLNAKNNSIDISSLNDGVYFVKVELMNGEADIRKIVKIQK